MLKEKRGMQGFGNHYFHPETYKLCLFQHLITGKEYNLNRMYTFICCNQYLLIGRSGENEQILVLFESQIVTTLKVGSLCTLLEKLYFWQTMYKNDRRDLGHVPFRWSTYEIVPNNLKK